MFITLPFLCFLSNNSICIVALLCVWNKFISQQFYIAMSSALPESVVVYIELF